MEATEVSEENLPPSSKKLKQAKLSFFKASAPPIKLASTPVPSPGIKRKLAGGSESPNKIAKLSKPLSPAVNNVESSANSKVSNGKTKKTPCQKTEVICDIEENDQEVSSSSEADVATGRKGGKCCLLEMFVRKLPKDVNQEISSTNEVLDISAESLDIEESKTEDDDCIINDDIEECKKMANTTEGTIQVQDDHLSKVMVTDVEKEIKKSSSASDEICIASKESTSKNETKNDVKLEKPGTGIFTPSKSSCFANEKSNAEISTPTGKASFGSPKDMSTPVSTAVSSFDTSHSSSSCETPKPNTSTKKRSRKVDSAKKAEMEAMRLKKKEEKEKEREEKKRKLEEEKMKKEQLRKELKEAKEKEKQQQKEKLEKERLEKLQAKEEEKKKKEEERLQKEEEKKKLLEAKQEEKRKKDEEKRIQEEEKRLKDEEKQKEEERKRKKAEKTKQAFQSFFFKPKEPEQKPLVVKSSASIFFPFQLKKDMHMAPAVRSNLTDEKKTNLDQYLQTDKIEATHYLDQLKNKEVSPRKTGRILRKNPDPEEEIEIIHDTEALKKAFHRVKLLQFHTDVRPPYFGTWRKTTSLNPRNPWYKDGATFDYEVDSEEEWEEEEPGESLSCSEGEEGEEKGEEGADDDEEDGWMVPHGYLSEDEGCNDDDEVTPEKLKMQQQAKAKAWEMEQKRKLQAAPVITVGCFYEHSPSQSMTGDVRLLYEFRGVIIAPVVPILTSQSLGSTTEDTGTEQERVTPKVKKSGGKKKGVPDDAMPHLIQLMHGNCCGIRRLVREFRVFWLKKHDQPSSNISDSLNDSGEASVLNDSMLEPAPSNEDKETTEKSGDVNEVKCEEGYGCSISKRQLEMKIMSIGVRDKRDGFNKPCWYVHSEVLLQYKMESLSLPNTWIFSSSGPNPNLNKSLNNSKMNPTDIVETEKETLESKPSDQRSITAFTMSREEILKQESLKPKPEPKPVEAMDVIEEKAKIPIKPLNDQRSIMTFTKTKEEISLLSSKHTDLAGKGPLIKQSEQNFDTSPMEASSPVSKNLSTVTKNPIIDKKPQISVMDMLRKSACKRKLPKEQVHTCKKNILDSDIEIIELSPTKDIKIVNPDLIRNEEVAMEVEVTPSSDTDVKADETIAADLDVKVDVTCASDTDVKVMPASQTKTCQVALFRVDQKKEEHISDVKVDATPMSDTDVTANATLASDLDVKVDVTCASDTDVKDMPSCQTKICQVSLFRVDPKKEEHKPNNTDVIIID